MKCTVFAILVITTSVIGTSRHRQIPPPFGSPWSPVPKSQFGKILKMAKALATEHQFRVEKIYEAEQANFADETRYIAVYLPDASLIGVPPCVIKFATKDKVGKVTEALEEGPVCSYQYEDVVYKMEDAPVC